MNNGNMHHLEVDGKKIILIGTAHVSPRSVEEVQQVIEQEKPDTVCVELCESRYQNIVNANRWKDTTITKIIKEGKALLLLINLILSSYQKKLAAQFDIKPGQEMLQGIQSAEAVGADLCLADRDLQTTMMRLWRSISIWGKFKLLGQLLMSMFITEDMDEEEIEKMKQGDILTAALDEFGQSLPQIKTVLIDERDQYLAQKIKEAPGNKVVAVLGAGHVPGVKRELANDHNLEQLLYIPPTSKYVKILGWVIPLLILGIIASTFSVNKAAGIDQIVAWVLWNGSLAALGTMLALGHPFSILTAFVVSPISSLSPLLAAGWFAGLTEALIREPKVQDFESISDDISSWRGFWRNKVLHILMVVALANIGSSLGAVIGGIEVIRHFIGTFI